MRVLIADDQREVGRALANLVRICNHEVVEVVASGLDAIQAYARHHPDLVLMDYRMPRLNGATACRNIVSKDPAARIILVSAWSPSDDSSASGAIAMLPKPVNLELLEATLQRVAETLPAPSPAEMPIPEASFQTEPIDYPITYSQFVEQPTPSSELEAFNFRPIPEPVPVPPSLEMSFPVEAPQGQLQQGGQAYPLAEEKIPIKPRRHRRRRVERVRVR